MNRLQGQDRLVPKKDKVFLGKTRRVNIGERARTTHPFSSTNPSLVRIHSKTPSILAGESNTAMSSPAQRRSQRPSASATPRRSTRNSQIPSSSPAPVGPDEQLHSEASQASQRDSQATPRNSRLQSASTQSPLFFRSSPVNSSAPANGAAESDGGATPRASGMTIGGRNDHELI